MGTRGLSGFKWKNEYYLMYNHYDSYPEGLGNDVIEFIKHVYQFNSFNKLKMRVGNLIKVNYDKEPTSEIIKKYEKYSDTSVSERTNKDWYCLFRTLQGKDILYEVLNRNVNHILDGEDFGKDSLFCEYAYIINLDTMEVDFYNGFQKSPQKGNYFGEEPNIITDCNGKKRITEYYPIAKVGSLEFLRIFYKINTMADT